MIIALTGTPGTGKTSVSKILIKNDFKVVDLNLISKQKGYIIEKDIKRDTNIVDVNGLNKYINDNYSSSDIVFVEGHLSHLLKCVDKIIILRCHPDKLRKNLGLRKWSKTKIKENIEAEILDVILCEAVDLHPQNNIFEIDATYQSINEVSKIIIDMVKKRFKNIKEYKIGHIDWSEEILKL